MLQIQQPEQPEQTNDSVKQIITSTIDEVINDMGGPIQQDTIIGIDVDHISLSKNFSGK